MLKTAIEKTEVGGLVYATNLYDVLYKSSTMMLTAYKDVGMGSGHVNERMKQRLAKSVTESMLILKRVGVLFLNECRVAKKCAPLAAEEIDAWVNDGEVPAGIWTWVATACVGWPLMQRFYDTYMPQYDELKKLALDVLKKLEDEVCK